MKGEEKSWVDRICDETDEDEGFVQLKQAMNEIGHELNVLVNRHILDLPLVVACIKLSMPHWERHLGESGRAAVQAILCAFVTVDSTELHRMEGK